jgi:hypothetical protein
VFNRMANITTWGSERPSSNLHLASPHYHHYVAFIIKPLQYTSISITDIYEESNLR